MRMPSQEIELWNRVFAQLGQAMIGAISPNFRQICLTREDDRWRVEFVLAEESLEDREEISECMSEFEGLLEPPANYDVVVRVSEEPLAVPGLPGRLLYRRRESVS